MARLESLAIIRKHARLRAKYWAATRALELREFDSIGCKGYARMTTHFGRVQRGLESREAWIDFVRNRDADYWWMQRALRGKKLGGRDNPLFSFTGALSDVSKVEITIPSSIIRCPIQLITPLRSEV